MPSNAAVVRLQRRMVPDESRVGVADDDPLTRESARPDLGRADPNEVRPGTSVAWGTARRTPRRPLRRAPPCGTRLSRADRFGGDRSRRRRAPRARRRDRGRPRPRPCSRDSASGRGRPGLGDVAHNGAWVRAATSDERFEHEPAPLGRIRDRRGAREVRLLAQDDENGRASVRSRRRRRAADRVQQRSPAQRARGSPRCRGFVSRFSENGRARASILSPPRKRSTAERSKRLVREEGLVRAAGFARRAFGTARASCRRGRSPAPPFEGSRLLLSHRGVGAGSLAVFGARGGTRAGRGLRPTCLRHGPRFLSAGAFPRTPL